MLAAALVAGSAGVAAAAETSTTTVVASDMAPGIGEPVTFTATITSAGNVVGGFGVFFYDGANALNPDDGNEPILVQADGTATLTTTFASTGSHTILAIFSGTSLPGGDIDASGSNGAVTINVTFATSATTVTATPNPAAVGELVTLLATVTAGGTVTGGLGVTFFADTTELGTVLVEPDGTAALTTTFASIGSRTITAAFNGTDSVGASNNTTTVLVETPAASVNIRAMQLLATHVAATTSARAFTDATEAAIANGFAGGDDLAIGPDGVDVVLDGGAWQVWANVRFTGIGGFSPSSTEGALSGRQLNGLAGFTVNVTPDLLFGIVGGFERFDYRSDDLDADLGGTGWTAGGYFGAQVGENLRFSAALGYSGLGYHVESDGATASFNAGRMIATAGLAGDFGGAGFVIAPSLDVFGLFEHQAAYTDSLGTAQDARSFMTGSVSAGLRVGYPLAVGGLSIAPYAGLYADFAVGEQGDELADLGLASPLATVLDGAISGRVIGGLTVGLGNQSSFQLGGTYEGLGRPLQSWSVTGGFNAAF